MDSREVIMYPFITDADFIVDDQELSLRFIWSDFFMIIPNKQLTELMEFILAQYFLICAVWKEHFATDSINYYC